MPARVSIKALETLLESRQGLALPLPPRLVRLFGQLRVPSIRGQPWVFSNFVSTLDGVVSLKVRGHEGGGDISGFSAQDRMVMGLLRATADAVVMGGGSLAADPERMWTAQAICPELAREYARFRRLLRHERPALRVVVSASGRVRFDSPVFAPGEGRVLVVTTRAGERALATQVRPEGVEVVAVGRGKGELKAPAILRALAQATAPQRILVEGGPRLLAGFYAARAVHDQFLTLAPQLAGREEDDGRISLIMGKLLNPRTPTWGRLADVRRGGSHLFLRYRFGQAGSRGA